MLVLDTNAVIYLQNDQLATPLAEDEYCISIMTEIELLSFSRLSRDHEALLNSFLKDIFIFPLDERVKNETIALRRLHKIKTPDAIICATAIVNNATLLTNDRQLLNLSAVKSKALDLK